MNCDLPVAGGGGGGEGNSPTWTPTARAGYQALYLGCLILSSLQPFVRLLIRALGLVLLLRAMAVESVEPGEAGGQVSLWVASVQFNPGWVDSARDTLPKRGAPNFSSQNSGEMDRPHPFPCSERSAGEGSWGIQHHEKRERAPSFFQFNKWPKAPLLCLIPPVPPGPHVV